MKAGEPAQERKSADPADKGEAAREERQEMKRYVALLRGINVSGRNRIAMPALRAGLEELGYAEVVTYLNSGNVLFSADERSESALAGAIRAMIRAQLALDIPVLVIAQAALGELLDKAPDWWGTEDAEIYDNLIFVLPDTTTEGIAEKIGEPTAGLERVSIQRRAIFWSFDRKRYAKANWWKKTAAAGIGEWLTIRTASTVRRLAGM